MAINEDEVLEKSINKKRKALSQDPNKPLTDKQKAFVTLYLRTGNAAQSALGAGYAATCAASMASLLMETPAIRQAIDKAKIEETEKRAITNDRVIDEVSRLSFSNIKNLLEMRNNVLTVKDIDSIPDAYAAAISEISIRRDLDGTPMYKIKLHNKAKALELMCKILNLTEGKITKHGSRNLLEQIYKNILDSESNNETKTVDEVIRDEIESTNDIEP